MISLFVRGNDFELGIRPFSSLSAIGLLRYSISFGGELRAQSWTQVRAEWSIDAANTVAQRVRAFEKDLLLIWSHFHLQSSLFGRWYQLQEKTHFRQNSKKIICKEVG